MVELILSSSKRTARPLSCVFLGALLLPVASVACGETTTDPKVENNTRNDPVVPGTLCELPEFEPKASVPLDKEKFITTLIDYSLGWSTPFHNALLELDELKIFQTWVEGVRGSYEKVCRDDTNWESLPPDDALSNEERRAKYRADMRESFDQAIEVESGDHVRLSFHECETCGQALGAAPLFIDATLDETGLLAITIELTEGSPWTKKFFISEKSVAAEAPLDALSTWGATANDDLRAGKVKFPSMSGTLLVQATRDDAGHLSGSIGLTAFSVTGDPGGKNETRVTSSSPCIGLSAIFAPSSEGSSASFFGGETDVELSGGTHCPNESSCGAAERDGTFAYHLGGANVTLTQSPTGDAYDTTVDLSFSSESNAKINGQVFANGGLGSDGKGGSVKLGANRADDSFLIAFEPKLDMAGAMMLSKFSEETRTSWPESLNDEIFDLTFGGEPVGSIRIPLRELCEDGVYPKPEVPRREVEIVTGSGTLAVGGGRTLAASPGQCVGRSLGDPNTFDLTSDYWEAGFECTK